MTVALKSTGYPRKVRSGKPAATASSSKVTPLARQPVTTLQSRLGIVRGITPVAAMTAGTASEKLPRHPAQKRDVVQIASGDRERSVVEMRVLPWMPPVWLRSLIGAQSITGAIAFLLVVAALVIYGSTVYSQQLWGKEYRKLEDLRGRERQLTAANELLKNQSAEGAEAPGAKLVPPDPTQVIFLERPRQPSAPTEQPVAATARLLEPPNSKVLGY